MPRNGSGTSSVINTFVIDTIADPDEVNANFTDVADQLTNSLPRDGQAGMNAPLPLQNGSAAAPALTFTSDADTGFYRSSANHIGVALGGVGIPLGLGPNYATKATNYTAVAADVGSVLRFTAAGTLSLDPAATLAANWHMTVIADGADVTIDPNGAETIDGAATLIVANGSSVRIICNGTAFYTDKALSKIQPFATLASAATTDLGTVGTQNVTVTGTTTITSFGTAANLFRRLVFSGILTLTHNATSMILPGATNITTAAGDVASFVSDASGNWRCVAYQSSDGKVGYKTGAGGSVTQATSKTTGVTLNKPTGKIIMNGAALASADAVRFTVTNSFCSASDIVLIQISGGLTPSTEINSYLYWAQAANGSFDISVYNRTVASRSEPIEFTFILMKGAYS